MKNIDRKELHILFQEIKSNNKSSFDILYEKYKNLVYTISFTVCKNSYTADEVVQNVFFKIWKLSKEKLPTSYELSWLYTITKNETIDNLRKKSNYIDIDSIYNIENDNDTLEDIIDIDSYNKKISSLNDIEKQIVSLKLLSNFTFKEIGELLNIPTATAQWKYYKSLNSLKIALANLAMFILTFSVYIKTKFQTNRNTASESSKSNKDSSSNSNSGVSISEINISSADSARYTTSTAVARNNNFNLSTGFLGISCLFLLFSIIFAIIFIKHQQKSKKKTSKDYMNK